MILVSLNCSGESLEKAIALFHTAYRTNRTFYDSFDKIFIFFSENLPKKNKHLIGMSGTLSSITKVEGHAFFSSEERLLLHSKSLIIENLAYNGLISERVAAKLYDDSNRFDKLQTNIPIDGLFKRYYSNIVERFNILYPNVSLVKLSVKALLPSYLTYSGIDGHSKLYGLQPDGNIGMFNIGDWGPIRRNNMLERICRSVCLSPNIYMYIRIIDEFCKNSLHEYMIGYRPMTRFRRRVYDLAIERLRPSSLMVEPPNIIFGNILDGISNQYTVEERSNIGVLKAFSDFLLGL